MQKFNYTLERYGFGWYWEVRYPSEGIGHSVTGWSFTKWGAKWSIAKIVRRDIRRQLSRERGQVVVRD